MPPPNYAVFPIRNDYLKDRYPRGRAAGRPRMKMHSNNRRRSRAIAGKRAVKGGTRLDIVDAWLSAEYEGGRHQVRIDMLAEIETTQELAAAEN